MNTLTIGLYDNVYCSTPQTIPFNSLVELIRTGSTKTEKSQSQVVTYNYNYSGKVCLNNISDSTGLIFLDFDKCKSDATVDIDALKSHYFNKYDFILTAYKSYSGKGLHFVVKADYDKQNFKSCWEQLNELFDRGLDQNSKKLTQFAYIPSDPSILYRQVSTTFQPTIINVAPRVANDLDLGFDFSELFGPEIRYRDFLPDDKFISVNKPVIMERYIFDINLAKFKYFKAKEGKRTKFLAYLSLQLIGLNPNTTLDRLIHELLYCNQIICEVPQDRQEVINIMTKNYDRFTCGELNINRFRKKKLVHWHKDCQLDGYSKQSLGIALLKKWRTAQYSKRITSAINEIILQGRFKVTQKIVSETCGLSIDTIKRNWDKFKADTTIKEYNTNYVDALKLIKKVQKVSFKKGAILSLLYKREIIRTSAPFTNENCTFLKIQSAIPQIQGKLTQKKVADATGLSLRTVKTYWKHLKPSEPPAKTCEALKDMDRLLSLTRKP